MQKYISFGNIVKIFPPRWAMYVTEKFEFRSMKY